MPEDTLKNRIRFSSTLSPDIEKILKQYSCDTGIPISKILDKCIKEYVERNPKNQIRGES